MRRFLVVVLALAGMAGNATAQLTTYTFSGVGSGTAGAAAFVSQAFTVTVVGDPTAARPYPGADILRIDDLAGTLAIDGVGAGSFTANGPTYVFVNRTNQTVGVGLYGYLDLLNLDDLPVFASYGLGAPFGPVSDTTPFFGQFARVPTTFGAVTFIDVGRATFQATVVVTPEPVTLALTLGGLAVLGAGARTLRRTDHHRSSTA